MELISKLLFWVANSLLIPDIIILLCLFVRSLILIGLILAYRAKTATARFPGRGWNMVFSLSPKPCYNNR